MNARRYLGACFCLSAVGIAACKKTSALTPLTLDETATLQSKIQANDVDYPMETLEERGSEGSPNQHGLTNLIADTVRGNREVDEIKTPRVVLPMLMKYTCGGHKINWRPISGGIEFFYNDCRDVADSESAPGDDGIDPFASPSERSAASEPKEEVLDDPDDPFKPTKKATKP